MLCSIPRSKAEPAAARHGRTQGPEGDQNFSGLPLFIVIPAKREFNGGKAAAVTLDPRLRGGDDKPL